MLHALLPAYIHRQSDEHLLELIQACELALLDGTSTHGDMTTLVECEKEMLQREHRRVRRTLAGIRPEDFIDPKVSLSSLAASHPVDLPAEVFDTESGSKRSGVAPQNKPVKSRPSTKSSQIRPAAKVASRSAQVKPKKFNFRKAVAKRFGTERRTVSQNEPQKSAAQPVARPVQQARGAKTAQTNAQPVPAKRLVVRSAPAHPSTANAAAVQGRPNLRTRATPQTPRRRETVPRMPKRDLQD